jgi:transposase
MMGKTHSESKLYVAMELSNKEWKLAFGDGKQNRQVTMPARDQTRFWREVAKAKAKFRLADDAMVLSCYEAGRDGFWIHHMLSAKGVSNLVVDPASIEVKRRAKHVKTDRLDAAKLLQMLLRYWIYEEKKTWSVVRVPSLEDEARRRHHRNAERIKKERRGHLARIRSLAVLHGLVFTRLPGDWSKVKDWSGQPLSDELIKELSFEQERLSVLERQLADLEKMRHELVKAAKKSDMVNDAVPNAERWSAKLGGIKGVGEDTSWTLCHEFLAWRSFKNRREVGAAAGLVGSPYNSGDSQREQGISKAGNARVRHLMTELAWRWLRFQPQSALSLWYERRFGGGTKRMRRVGIVALSRKLLIALWKYGAHGELPEGAILTA